MEANRASGRADVECPSRQHDDVCCAKFVRLCTEVVGVDTGFDWDTEHWRAAVCIGARRRRREERLVHLTFERAGRVFTVEEIRETLRRHVTFEQKVAAAKWFHAPERVITRETECVSGADPPLGGKEGESRGGVCCCHFDPGGFDADPKLEVEPSCPLHGGAQGGAQVVGGEAVGGVDCAPAGPADAENSPDDPGVTGAPGCGGDGVVASDREDGLVGSVEHSAPLPDSDVAVLIAVASSVGASCAESALDCEGEQRIFSGSGRGMEGCRDSSGGARSQPPTTLDCRFSVVGEVGGGHSDAAGGGPSCSGPSAGRGGGGDECVGSLAGADCCPPPHSASGVGLGQRGRRVAAVRSERDAPPVARPDDGLPNPPRVGRSFPASSVGSGDCGDEADLDSIVGRRRPRGNAVTRLRRHIAGLQAQLEGAVGRGHSRAVAGASIVAAEIPVVAAALVGAAGDAADAVSTAATRAASSAGAASSAAAAAASSVVSSAAAAVEGASHAAGSAIVAAAVAASVSARGTTEAVVSDRDKYWGRFWPVVSGRIAAAHRPVVVMISAGVEEYERFLAARNAGVLRSDVVLHILCPQKLAQDRQALDGFESLGSGLESGGVTRISLGVDSLCTHALRDCDCGRLESACCIIGRHVWYYLESDDLVKLPVGVGSVVTVHRTRTARGVFTTLGGGVYDYEVDDSDIVTSTPRDDDRDTYIHANIERLFNKSACKYFGLNFASRLLYTVGDTEVHLVTRMPVINRYWEPTREMESVVDSWVASWRATSPEDVSDDTSFCLQRFMSRFREVQRHEAVAFIKSRVRVARAMPACDSLLPTLPAVLDAYKNKSWLFQALILGIAMILFCMWRLRGIAWLFFPLLMVLGALVVAACITIGGLVRVLSWSGVFRAIRQYNPLTMALMFVSPLSPTTSLVAMLRQFCSLVFQVGPGTTTPLR